MENRQKKKRGVCAKHLDVNYTTKQLQNFGKIVPTENPPKNWEKNFHVKMLWLAESNYVDKYLRLA